MTKPTEDLDWATNGTVGDILEPTGGQRTKGIAQGSSWTRKRLNWMFNGLGKWIDWLQNEVRSNTENDARFLLESNNLSDLTNTATAIDNLGLRDNTDNDARFVQHTEVVNNLTSTSTTNPLSAAQGKGLQDTTVKLTGTQTVAGAKTFSANPLSSAGQSGAASALTRKDYVDGNFLLKSSVLNTIYPVGSVYLCMDNVTPASKFGGSWALIHTDGNLTFGNGATQSGAVTGDNNPPVPLLAHSHTVSGIGTNDNSSNVLGGSEPIFGGLSNATAKSKTTTSVGSPAVTINVRGAGISINVYQRTA